jgi:hypothetical protein
MKTACPSCRLLQKVQFNSEMAVHLPFSMHTSRTHVFLFPKICVCLNCGSAEFVVPKVELHRLATDEADAPSAP